MTKSPTVEIVDLSEAPTSVLLDLALEAMCEREGHAGRLVAKIAYAALAHFDSLVDIADRCGGRLGAATPESLLDAKAATTGALEAAISAHLS